MQEQSAQWHPLCPVRAPRPGEHCTILRVVSLARKPAQLISAATRLPLLAAPLFLAVGAQAAGWPGLLWGLLCLFLTSGLSLVYLAYLARSGKVRDPRSIPQAERVRPLRVVAALHAAAFVIVSLLGAAAPLRAALLSYALATLLFALLTPVANLSLHAAGVSGAAVCLVYVFGAWGLPAPLPCRSCGGRGRSSGGTRRQNWRSAFWSGEARRGWRFSSSARQRTVRTRS